MQLCKLAYIVSDFLSQSSASPVQLWPCPPSPFLFFLLIPDYAQYLGEAAKALALSQPALPALLLVGAMCAGLSAATLWMQSVQLWVPLAFYRTEPNRVRQGAAWGRLGGVRLELEITLCELRRCNAAVDAAGKLTGPCDARPATASSTSRAAHQHDPNSSILRFLTYSLTPRMPAPPLPCPLRSPPRPTH